MTGHPCPFVRAVVDGDADEVDRLNRLDGRPAEPAVLELLETWARQADAGEGFGVELEECPRPHD